MNERNTKQKNLILNAIKSSHIHPTAEEVYECVVGELPNVSLTTVYRNLNKLSEQGVIKRILIPNQPDRFERNPTKHYHICCERCGAFEDIHEPNYNLDLDGFECKESGYLILNHEIIFKGLCPECRKQIRI